MSERSIPRGLYDEALATYERLRPTVETARYVFYDLTIDDWRHLLKMARNHLEAQVIGANDEDGHIERCRRYLKQLQRLEEGSTVRVEQRRTEFFFTYGTAQKAAEVLRDNNWKVSVGTMRRKDGKDFYLRAWRRAVSELNPCKD